MEAESGCCGVCCEEEITNLITCGGCGHNACARCVETYLLGTTSDPHCMGCKQAWGVLFMRKHLNPEFLGGSWKERRVALLRARARRRVADGGVLCPCPSCPRGSISSSTQTCSVCWARACPRCLGHWEEGHACREDVVRSLEHIRGTTRRCPGCHAPIEKRSGCFQMFCTQCHTSFDWKDGRVLDNIHNPHYYDHLEEDRRLRALLVGADKELREFGRLVAEVGRQARQSGDVGGGGGDLFEEDEARRREQCRRDLWFGFYKRGASVLLRAASGEPCDALIRSYVCDLKEELIEYNEHVGGRCLLLRGNRLFPCRASVLACA